MQIIPIASGKGGVGKSLVAANLAVALAQSGKRVVLADLDLGGSNLHLILGLRAVPQGIGTFFSSSSFPFESLIIDTETPNLRFIPGDNEIPGMANLKQSQKKNLIRHLLNLSDTDFLILDLGAGTNSNTLDFFLLSNHGIVVTTPTLTATVNAYFFIKNAIFRLLDTSFEKTSWARLELDRRLASGSGVQKLYVSKFLDEVKKNDQESYAAYKKATRNFQPRFLLNMLDDPKDVDKVSRVRRSCREYLDVDLEHLGVIYRDELQDVALASRLPIILYKPQAVLSQAIYRIADKMIQFERADTGPLDLTELEETYQTATLEAEIDFSAKLAYLEELLDTGALSTGDLVEAVRSQQFEITQLKKENTLLKSKIVQAIQSGYKF
ncbi:MAG: P-loop NTPase [Spirochaetales bacterium]|nr:P-loop NTPase [Spirochaetales bacterium]